MQNSKKRKHEKETSGEEKWEKFINQKELEVWRRPVDTTGLFEYKGMSRSFVVIINMLFSDYKYNVS